MAKIAEQAAMSRMLLPGVYKKPGQFLHKIKARLSDSDKETLKNLKSSDLANQRLNNDWMR